VKSPDVNGWSSCLLTGFKGEVGGATSKEGAFSEHRDVTANRLKAWGVYVETYDSGDKITYNYHMSVAVKDGAVQSGKGTYQATGGTGKMKGIRRRARARTAAALMAQRTTHAPAITHSLELRQRSKSERHKSQRSARLGCPFIYQHIASLTCIAPANQGKSG
jgi:hypothetical protein